MRSFREEGVWFDLDHELELSEESPAVSAIEQSMALVSPGVLFADRLEARLREASQPALQPPLHIHGKVVGQSKPAEVWKAGKATSRSAKQMSLVGMGLAAAVVGVFWLSLFYNPGVSIVSPSTRPGNGTLAASVSPSATENANFANVMNPPGIPAPNAPGWYTFTAPIDFFSVLMPRQLVDVGGRDGWNSYGVKDGATTYMVEDTFNTILSPNDPNKWFEATLPSLVADMSGSLVGQKPVTLSGLYPGRELSIRRTDGRFTRSRIFLVGNRVYNVFAIAVNEKSALVPEIDRYLGSFALSNGSHP
jgi:hypothetical protein